MYTQVIITNAMMRCTKYFGHTVNSTSNHYDDPASLTSIVDQVK